MRLTNCSLLCVTTLLGLVSNANPLSPSKVESITSYVRTESNGVALDLKIVTKKNKGIRTTLVSPDGNSRAVLIFNQETLYLHQERGLEQAYSGRLTGREAAENIFQMLAINPCYHFLSEAPVLRTTILNHYEIILDRETHHEFLMPKRLLLYKGTSTEGELLSTIEFIDFFPSKIPFYQPKTLQVINHSNQTKDQVQVKSFSYNLGLANYLFETPKDEPLTQVSP